MLEQDRFKQNNLLFITCLFCLLLSLGLFVFALYILPHLIWDWHYEVPEFIAVWREWFKNYYNTTENYANAIIFLVFLIPSVLAGIISCITSNLIENRLFNIDSEISSVNKASMNTMKDSINFGLKLISILLLVLMGAFLFEWLLKVPEPTTETSISSQYKWS